MKSLRLPRKWTVLSAVAFFCIAILTSWISAPADTWDSILNYMLSLMGVLGAFILAVQAIIRRDVARRSGQSAKAPVRAENE